MPHAELEIIEGMAHYLPQACLPQIAAALLRHLNAARAKVGVIEP